MSVGHPEPTEPKSTVSAGMGSRGSRGSRLPSAYYSSPFQKHYDQLGGLHLNYSEVRTLTNKYLEQEYDAQADMIDDEHDSPVGPSPFVQGYNSASSVSNASHAVNPHGMNPYSHPSGEGVNGAYNNSNAMIGSYESMLDNDPFGLTASMHFPTPFSYEQSGTRQ